MIPALAFNDANVAISDDAQVLRDHLATVVPKVNDFAVFNGSEKFLSKASAIRVNGLVVNVASHNGVFLEREIPEMFDLVIPMEGYTKGKADGKTYEAIGGSTALLANSERHHSASVGSKAVIHLNHRRLYSVAAAMLAENSRPLTTTGSRLLPIEVAKISFLNLFRTLLSQIDYSNNNIPLLEKLAFDDRIYRLSAGLIFPNLLLSDELGSGRRPQVSSEIDILCEYLRANLKQSISLTQMEQMSGLSARKLQYAFRKEFGMGAIEWLRKQRLHAAHSALIDTHEQTTVAFVAYDFCFVSASELSRHYQQEFGELPEQTIRRGR